MKYNFLPSKEFTQRARDRFLTAFDARYPSVVTPWHARIVFTAKALASVLAIAAVVLGSASVYADTRNVPVNDPLYPLKRLNESVRLAVAPPQEKPQLQASFVARRVSELNDLEEKDPSSTAIVRLANDAGNAVSASITAADNSNLQDGQLTHFCGTLFSAIATSSPAFRDELENHRRALERFESKCEGADADAENAAEDANDASSSVPAGPINIDMHRESGRITAPPQEASSSAPSSTTNPADKEELQIRIQNYLERHPVESMDNKQGGQDAQSGVGNESAIIGVNAGGDVSPTSTQDTEGQNRQEQGGQRSGRGDN